MPPKRVAANPADKRPAAEPLVSPAPKRRRTTTVPDSSDEEEESPEIVARATATGNNAITPMSIKSRPKRNDRSDDADVDDGNENDEVQAPNRSGKEPRVVESDVFSCEFYRATAPAIDAYYNREANLIRLQCAEYDREREVTEAKIKLMEARTNSLMDLLAVESKYSPCPALDQFRQMQAENAALALENVQKERETIRLNMAKYEADIQAMRKELNDREEEAEARKAEAKEAKAVEVEAEAGSGLEALQALRDSMMNIRA